MNQRGIRTLEQVLGWNLLCKSMCWLTARFRSYIGSTSCHLGMTSKQLILHKVYLYIKVSCVPCQLILLYSRIIIIIKNILSRWMIAWWQTSEWASSWSCSVNKHKHVQITVKEENTLGHLDKWAELSENMRTPVSQESAFGFYLPLQSGGVQVFSSLALLVRPPPAVCQRHKAWRG